MRAQVEYVLALISRHSLPRLVLRMTRLFLTLTFVAYIQASLLSMATVSRPTITTV